MSPALVFGILAAYFAILMIVAALTSKNTSNATFFIGNHKSPWILVAYGMIGASLSGVSLISVPGEVGNNGFSYFQFVLGYPLGYLFIALILMPIYYRLGLISIYSYLHQRFGNVSYHTGAALFFISQSLGASLRLFLAASVLQMAFFDAFGIPFFVTVIIILALIWAYTYRSGIRTIVWTDTLQTTLMLAAVFFSVIAIGKEMNLDLPGLTRTIAESDYSKIFNWDWRSSQNFFKQFFSGAFICIVMTGLDQNMMQKNLTCPNIKDAQKNMITYSFILIPVNLIFLSLGALLFQYVNSKGLNFQDPSGFYFDKASGIYRNTDQLYPMLALKYFPKIIGISFLLGIVAAALSSADSAITALTTSFCVDFLKIKGEENIATRRWVHLGVSALMLAIIMAFKALNDKTVINAIYTIAGYTYGPLLGLFMFGLFTRRKLKDGVSPYIAILIPTLCYFISSNSVRWLNGYTFGYELLLLNGLLTFFALWIFSESATHNKSIVQHSTKFS
ncbi:MAG TPA: sodium:solute symporter [Bacteroidales bacterium]|jgi:SSS family transporter|nr:sodium:solute symporter [Bacteroidales bacterium]HQQ01480.1 sodium:solute symporter [Bacteroidales bacterium]